MANPFSETAFQADRERRQREKGSRVLREYSVFAKRGFNVAYVYVAGEPVLVIAPPSLGEGCSKTGIRRRDMSIYLSSDGGIDHAHFDVDVVRWLAQMGKENTKDNRNTIADILTHVWSDIYNTEPDKLIIDPRRSGAEVRVLDQDGRVIREATI